MNFYYHFLLFNIFYFGIINGNDTNLYEEIAFNFIEYYEKNIYNDSSCFKILSIDNVSNLLRYSDFDFFLIKIMKLNVSI